MFPSSAAMLKNLQQKAMTSPSFLMENLLQSKGPGGDFNLTLNWAASLMTRQRERDVEAKRVLDGGLMCPTVFRGSQLHQSSKVNLDDCDRALMMVKDGVGQDMDVDNDKVDVKTGIVDRLTAIERLSERIENRSGSTVDSNHSVEEDRMSNDMDIACHERDHLDRRFEFEGGVVGHPSDVHMETERYDRIGEETCTCGDESCVPCQRIQEKEKKPHLKFSVNAILGGNYDRRPNPGKDAANLGVRKNVSRV